MLQKNIYILKFNIFKLTFLFVNVFMGFVMTRYNNGASLLSSHLMCVTRKTILNVTFYAVSFIIGFKKLKMSAKKVF